MSSGAEAGVGHGPLGRLDDHPDGPAEDLLAVHEQGPAVLALEQVPERAVGVQVPAEQAARAVHRLDDDGAGPVADDDGDLAVVHVGDARERLGADQQDRARPDGDEAGRRDEAVDEARAGGVEVEGAALHADPVLHASARCPGRCRRASSWPARGCRSPRRSARPGPGPPAAASMARPDVVPPMWRSRMPVRSMIHSSLVSRLTAMSSLVTTLSGTAMPQPVIRMPVTRRIPARTAWMPTNPASP